MTAGSQEYVKHTQVIQLELTMNNFLIIITLTLTPICVVSDM